MFKKNPLQTDFQPRELSNEDIERMTQQLSKDLSPASLNEFRRILQNFKKGSTTQQQVDGMVVSNCYPSLHFVYNFIFHFRFNC